MEDWQYRVLRNAIDYHNRMVAGVRSVERTLILADVMDMADEMERQRVNLLGLATDKPPEIKAFARDLRGRLLSTWRWLALKADNRPVKVRPVAVELPE